MPITVEEAWRVSLDIVRRDAQTIGQLTLQVERMAAEVERLQAKCEALSRALCKRDGIEPDEIVADGGYVAWQVHGHDVATRENGT